MDERWDELWTNTLKPWLDELEVERKQALRHRLYCLAGGFAAGFAVGGLLYLWAGDGVFFFFGLFVSTVIGGIVGNQRVSRLAKQVKTRLNSAVAEALDLSYMESRPSRRGSRPCATTTCCPPTIAAISRTVSPANGRAAISSSMRRIWNSGAGPTSAPTMSPSSAV